MYCDSSENKIMYYVLSKNKKTNVKLTHEIIINTIKLLYPNSIIELHENMFNGEYILCNLPHETFSIKLNKYTTKPRIIYDNIPKNSYVFHMSNNALNEAIVTKFNLLLFTD